MERKWRSTAQALRDISRYRHIWDSLHSRELILSSRISLIRNTSLHMLLDGKGRWSLYNTNTPQHWGTYRQRSPIIQAGNRSTGRHRAASSGFGAPGHAISAEQFTWFFLTLRPMFSSTYNAKRKRWGCPCTNPKGRSLFKSMQNLKHHAISTRDWPACTLA